MVHEILVLLVNLLKIGFLANLLLLLFICGIVYMLVVCHNFHVTVSSKGPTVLLSSSSFGFPHSVPVSPPLWSCMADSRSDTPVPHPKPKAARRRMFNSADTS